MRTKKGAALAGAAATGSSKLDEAGKKIASLTDSGNGIVRGRADSIAVRGVALESGTNGELAGELVTILLDKIHPGTQTRVRVDRDMVNDYAEKMEAGVMLPPPIVYKVDGEYLLEDGFHRYQGYDNDCLIVSVENQARADERIPVLVAVPAKKRGLSIEPLLGPVTLSPEWLERLAWVICGGESGDDSRPTHPDWIRALRDQCAAAGILFFFKQWGNWCPDASLCKPDYSNVVAFLPGRDEPIYLKALSRDQREKLIHDQSATLMYRGTKHETRNFLDGRQHLDHPFEKPIRVEDGNSDIPRANKQSFQAPKADTGAIIARARKLASDYQTK